MSRNTISSASENELSNRLKILNLFKKSPLPNDEIIANISLFLKRQELSKILFFNEIYKLIVDQHGVIIEFGCRWGQNLITLSNLRGIYEPYNYNRKILGFDTFQGFINLDDKDGSSEIMKEGSFSVSKGYEDYLKELLFLHEQESPLAHISKNEVITGEAENELRTYLEKNPQTLIAFAWFDFDLYRPTKACLELIRPHLTKGSVLGFDQINDHRFPGESLALKEFADLHSLKIQRNTFSSMQSYFII